MNDLWAFWEGARAGGFASGLRASPARGQPRSLPFAPTHIRTTSILQGTWEEVVADPLGVLTGSRSQDKDMQSLQAFHAASLTVEANLLDTSTFRRPPDRGDGSIAEYHNKFSTWNTSIGSRQAILFTRLRYVHCDTVLDGNLLVKA